ncbi:MAG TPA: DUF3604 domain-containing protein [Candidatus Acidoferrum sp.]|nr:DUF3604 domain-containing protein [Candidatus Acidoferrum sp.]
MHRRKDAVRFTDRQVFRFRYLLLSMIIVVLCSPFASLAVAQQTNDTPTQPSTRPAPNPLKNAYFGDLHVHTSYSLDAYTLDNRNDPRSAYRYGRGEEVVLPGGIKSKLRVPLDFMAVTDHDVWLGEVSLCLDHSDSAFNTPACQALRATDTDQSSSGKVIFGLAAAFTAKPARRNANICGTAEPTEDNKCFQRARSVWRQIQKNADDYYEPGKFTTLYGFEWTAGFARVGMLHRNVIFRGTPVPDSIYSAVELNNSPERLWQWLGKACTGDCQVISIPHNTNFGWGIALDTKNSDGTPFTAEGLQRRAKTEPLIEIFQIKGNSECAPGLGTNDEQCNFEQLFKPCKPGEDAFCAVARDYVRNALKTGLVLEQQYGVNPFKYGFISDTDTHSSAPGSTEEDRWNGGGGVGDSTPQARLFSRTLEEFPVPTVAFNPGGLAGVWAEENTREAIFDGLKRRETFATSGTRIRVRFFGGWNYPRGLEHHHDVVAEAYKGGVPMGADLPSRPASGGAPRFLLWATKDPSSANLQKLQVIKGWADGTQTFERVYDVSCSDGLKPDGKTHRCPDNGATVNQADCSYSSAKGAAELSTTWTDPDFKPSDRAFYYVRVLENPTCRWSTYDAHKLNVPVPAAVSATIQERAWSSPIWYEPSPAKQ